MPDYQSVEVLGDGRVTFRLCAPEATTVRLISSDAADVIPLGFGDETPGLAMSKDDEGLWTVTTPAPLEVDTFRFVFRVNGVDVADPEGSSVIGGYPGGVSSVVATGREAGAFQAYDRNVPHGAVSRIEYWSSSLNVKRPAVVYTPPGYMTGDAAYPVLYLVHGAGDREDGWTAIGRAHYILDNLIAAGKAEPMIIVMPLGHTPPRPDADMLANTDFSDDLLTDLVPFIEANFRTVNERGARAMAGLSMGGAHTMATGLVNPELFAYIGIFSMGLMSAERVDAYEARNAAALGKASESMKLVYYAMGKTFCTVRSHPRGPCSRSTASSMSTSKARAATLGPTVATTSPTSCRGCSSERACQEDAWSSGSRTVTQPRQDLVREPLCRDLCLGRVRREIRSHDGELVEA